MSATLNLNAPKARYGTGSGSDLVNITSYQVATAPRTVLRRASYEKRGLLGSLK